MALWSIARIEPASHPIQSKDRTVERHVPPALYDELSSFDRASMWLFYGAGSYYVDKMFPVPERNEMDNEGWREGYKKLPVGAHCATNDYYQRVLRRTQLSDWACNYSFQTWQVADKSTREIVNLDTGLNLANAFRVFSRISRLVYMQVVWDDTVIKESLLGMVGFWSKTEANNIVGFISSSVVTIKNSIEAGNTDEAVNMTKYLVENLSRVYGISQSHTTAGKVAGPVGQLINAAIELRDLVKDWSETDLEYLWYENNREKTFNAYLTTLKKHQANMSLLQEIVYNGCVAQDPTPPPPNGGRQVASASPNRLFVGDPNDKLTVGYSQEGFIVPGARLVYTIRFENETNATAAVQLVAVTDQLDPNLDWSTFELMGMGCNLVELPVPAGLDHYATNTIVATDPYNVVAVRATLDPVTGVVSWVMETIDPITQDVPEDPLRDSCRLMTPSIAGKVTSATASAPSRTLANGPSSPTGRGSSST